MDPISVTQSTFNHLKNLIIAGRLAPGQRLDENMLANHFNISRPPLREAFRFLAHDHLVDNIPRKGTFVSVVTVEDFIELYQARRVVELAAVDLIKENRIKDFKRIEIFLEEEAKAKNIYNGTWQSQLDWVMKIQGFHRELVKRARNARLSYFYNAINSNVVRYTYIYLKTAKIKEQIDEHTEILELIKSNHYVQAKKLISAHINFYINQSFLEDMQNSIEEYISSYNKNGLLELQNKYK